MLREGRLKSKESVELKKIDSLKKLEYNLFKSKTINPFVLGLHAPFLLKLIFKKSLSKLDWNVNIYCVC